MRKLRLLFAVLLVASCAPAAPPPPPPVVAPPPEPPEPPGLSDPTARTEAQLKRDDALAARASSIIDWFENRIPGFAGQVTPDGKHIVFGSSRDGTPQILMGDVASPGDVPARLTEGPERVLGAVVTRDGKAVLFTRDHEGDENSHVFRVGLSGEEEPVDLTPGEGVRYDTPVLPWSRPDLMVVGRRTAASPASTILVQPIWGGEARVAYRDAAPAFVRDVAPDGSRALVMRVVSPCNSVLLEVDLAAGTARRLWPAEGKVEGVTSAAYGIDGGTVLLGTDQGSDSSAVVALDVASGTVQARWSPQPATAHVDTLVVAPRGDLVAARVDAGNRTELRLLDARTLAEKPRPPVPLGYVEVGGFTADGKLLSLALSSPDRPAEVYALDVANVAKAKLRPLRNDNRRELVKLAPIETTMATVPAFDGQPIPVHAYLPKDRGQKKLPVVTLFHGGPGMSSYARWSPWAQFFVSLGYAWVEPNVRGSSGFGRAWEMADQRDKRAGVIEDMGTVNAWIRTQPWADPSRIVIAGGSYGGWMALMGLERQPKLWSAGLDLFGIADLRTLLRTTDRTVRAMFVEEFGDPDADAALLAAWSPLGDVARIGAPLFVYQGQNDPRVPRPESDAIVKALRKRGVAVEYMVAEDEGHSVARRENQIELLSRAARFLEERLAPAARSP